MSGDQYYNEYYYYLNNNDEFWDMGMGRTPVLDRHTPMIKDKPITDKNKPKLDAIDAALRNITMYLSSRHAGRYHSIWHFSDGVGSNADRVFICEWRNPEPVLMHSPQTLSLKDVLDLIEEHTVYMPAIAIDGDA